ncbi:hypothetical protein B5E41_30015 [Rhizobium esperanzae]|uniref:Uncharacterized protein n=1 Tax=Rhizobium esperanzae TaxID=1967781 RepID=A0A246DKU4_9HYPH|nr:hypothetical protein [Rhizobium esperanzae]OWO89717.1 hypothetical protein B5E41_30015 [Rhizobium esperanzae]
MAKSFDESEFEASRSGNFGDLLQGRDYLFFLLDNLDWDSQLLAVRMMIARNRHAAEAFSKAIERDEEEVQAYRGPHHHHYVDQHTDMLHESIFRDAAESMAAIGMIAPMVESTLGQSLAALGEMYTRKNLTPPEHKRWKRANGDPARWNCQIYFNNKGEPKNNILEGFPQLAAASGLEQFLSPGFHTWFKAMFTYRNFMFHGGFEWSLERRAAFKEAIEKNGWDVFTCSKTGGEPWAFYITDEAINQMPTMVESMLDSLAQFAKSLPFELISDP